MADQKQREQDKLSLIRTCSTKGEEKRTKKISVSKGWPCKTCHILNVTS